MQINFLCIVLLTSITMFAFAGNSLLCRIALKETVIDPASFTTIRLLSGAAMLWLIVRIRRGAPTKGGSWLSASALFMYAAGFSFAYVSLTAATGALLLFGAVQATMIGYGVWSGERLIRLQLLGLLLALGGLVGLVLPGLAAPPLIGSLLMIGAGISWGIYSLRGRGSGDAIGITAGNFLRTIPIALGLSVVTLNNFSADSAGILFALASGAVTSGIGYAVWYAVLPSLRSTAASTVQLSVPVIAALGGVMILDEEITLRLILASAAILGGIGLVIHEKK